LHHSDVALYVSAFRIELLMFGLVTQAVSGFGLSRSRWLISINHFTRSNVEGSLRPSLPANSADSSLRWSIVEIRLSRVRESSERVSKSYLLAL